MNTCKVPLTRYRVTFMLIACVTLFSTFLWTTTYLYAQSDNRYAVVIDRVTTTMGDQSGEPEFFAKIYHPDTGKWHKTTKVSGRNFTPPATKMKCSNGLCQTHPRIPDWGIAGYVSPGTNERIIVRLTEEDKLGSDDHVDISRGSDKDLSIYVGQYWGKPYVYFDGSWRQCPRVSQVNYPHYVCQITSSGDKGDKATVKLSVQFPPAPTP